VAQRPGMHAATAHYAALYIYTTTTIEVYVYTAVCSIYTVIGIFEAYSVYVVVAVHEYIYIR
jgi:hypothetical protein